MHEKPSGPVNWESAAGNLPTTVVMKLMMSLKEEPAQLRHTALALCR